jgi:hypothetical protein
VFYDGFFPVGHKELGSLLITDFTGAINSGNSVRENWMDFRHILEARITGFDGGLNVGKGE